jgi:hypothetical protein
MELRFAGQRNALILYIPISGCMGTLSGVKIADNTSKFVSGGAFPLAQTPENSEIVSLDDWEVKISSGSPYVIAQSQESNDSEAIFDASYEAAQKGLDILSIEGTGDYNCHDAVNRRIIWWREDGKQILRVITISALSVNTHFTAEARDEDGNIISHSKPDPIDWHECFRYFRLSQTTDDLFDAYRNYFLAFEMLLSSVVPLNKGEREKDWLKRALKQLNQKLPLEKSAPDKSNVVESIYHEQYVDTRLRLFHAKTNKPTLRPQNQDDRQQVQKAMDNLAYLFRTIVHESLNIISQGGIMTYNGFDYMMQPLRSSGEILVSSSSGNASYEERIDDPQWSNAIPISTEYSPELSEPGLRCVLGRADNLYDFSTIQRIGLQMEDEAQSESVSASSDSLDVELTIENTDRFEAQVGIELRNPGIPKKKFPQ